MTAVASTLYGQFSHLYNLNFPKPVMPEITKANWVRVFWVLMMGFPAAMFAAVGTFSEFVASRGVTDMNSGLIFVSAVLGILAFEFALLALPFLKAWVDTAWYRYAITGATFLAWAVSSVANINLILGLLETSEPVDGYVWTARVSFVLLTGLAGATIAVLMGEVAGGIVLKNRRDNERAVAHYHRALEAWNRDKRLAWETSPEYKGVQKDNRNKIRSATASDLPKLDWRTLSEQQKSEIATCSTVDEVMQMFNMVPEQRKTANNWLKRSQQIEKDMES